MNDMTTAPVDNYEVTKHIPLTSKQRVLVSFDGSAVVTVPLKNVDLTDGFSNELVDAIEAAASAAVDKALRSLLSDWLDDFTITDTEFLAKDD